MDIWIVVPYGMEKYTRGFTTEQKAQVYQHKWERQLVEAEIFKTRLNKESNHEPPQQG